MEVGAGTFHTATFLRAIGPEPWRAAYVQPSRRPTDGRYGDNPFRLQHYYQFQVLLKPSPPDILELYLGSLRALGFDPRVNDVRFVEDNWESPTLGAWGLGWEVWLNGMEITQFTYFQQVGGLDCSPVSGEITYGLERLAMYLQGVESIFDIVWTDGPRGPRQLRRRVPPERSRAVAPTTSSTPIPPCCCAISMTTSAAAGMLLARAAAARLRAGAARLAHLQSARCAPRNLRDRAGALYPARPHAGARRRAGLLRQPRGRWVSPAQDAGRLGQRRRRRSPARMAIDRGAAERAYRAARSAGRTRHRGTTAQGPAHSRARLRRWTARA